AVGRCFLVLAVAGRILPRAAGGFDDSTSPRTPHPLSVVQPPGSAATASVGWAIGSAEIDEFVHNAPHFAAGGGFNASNLPSPSRLRRIRGRLGHPCAFSPS
ncbi:MAG: hypothetical protein ACREC5_06475, partial [Thermoplasmata archaeon]